MKWTEAMIRREMGKLDKKTGLTGSELPIVFSNGYSCLGAFHCDSDSNLFNDYYIKKEQNNNILLEELKMFKVGSKIRHPVFGTGYVTTIHGRNVGMYFEVEFYSVGIKTLTAKWVNENC